MTDHAKDAEALFLAALEKATLQERAAFVEKLLSVAPSNLKRVFLSNSGSESVEAAIKFARASTGRKKIVAAMRGFHGRTMGALSATWRRDFREPFEPRCSQGRAFWPWPRATTRWRQHY